MANERKAATRYRVLKEIVCEAIPDPAYAPMIEKWQKKRRQQASLKKDAPPPRDIRKLPRKNSGG